MIRAVIFDCFGVLTRDGWVEFCDTHFTPGSLAMGEADQLNRMAVAGLLSYDDFLQQAARLAGVSEAELRRMVEITSPNKKLFTYIRGSLKPHYKIGMLSNAAVNWLDRLFEPWQVALFDDVVLSYEAGLSKPDAVAYQEIANRLGVTTEECLFIDDHPGYCDAARRAGMQAIHYKDNQQLAEILGKYNIKL